MRDGESPGAAGLDNHGKLRCFLLTGLLVVMCGCTMATRGPPAAKLSPTERSSPGWRPWRVVLPGPGSSQITGMTVQAGDVFAIGSLEGETTLGGQKLASSGEQDVLVLRLDRNGQVRWARRWGGSGYDSGDAIEPGADGSLLVMGDLTGAVDLGGTVLAGSGDSDCFIAKLAEKDGHPLWVRRFGGAGSSACRAAAFDREGDVFVTGRFDGEVDLGFGPRSSAGMNDLFLVKLSGHDGSPRWARVFGGLGDDIGRDVAVDAAGTVILTGHFSSGVEPSAGAVDFGSCQVTSAGDSDAFLAAFSDDGRCLWARAIGGPAFDMAKSVVPAPDGSLFLTGLFQGNVTPQPGQLLFSAGGFEGFVARYSSRGEELWRHRYPALTSGHALALTSSGDLAMVGHFTSTLDLGSGRQFHSQGKNDVVAAIFSAAGELRWAQRLGEAGADYGYAVATLPGGVVVGGMLAEPPASRDSKPSSHGFITAFPLP